MGRRGFTEEQLIAVLFSSMPLTPALAMSLHLAAVGLHRRDESVGEVIGDLVRGQVRNLRKDVLLGTIGGPAFEAEVDTERGALKVSFILTRAGLELAGDEPRRRDKALLN